MKVFLEYVWLDGNQPQQLRSKTKVVNSSDFLQTLEDLEKDKVNEN